MYDRHVVRVHRGITGPEDWASCLRILRTSKTKKRAKLRKCLSRARTRSHTIFAATPFPPSPRPGNTATAWRHASPAGYPKTRTDGCTGYHNGANRTQLSRLGSNTPPHLLPTRGAARVGLVLLLGALLAEVVPAVGHYGVTEPLPADNASERKVVVALHLFQPGHHENHKEAPGNSGRTQQQEARGVFSDQHEQENIATWKERMKRCGSVHGQGGTVSVKRLLEKRVLAYVDVKGVVSHSTHAPRAASTWNALEQRKCSTTRERFDTEYIQKVRDRKNFSQGRVRDTASVIN